jgi:prophage tail gpP-like protein
MKGQKVWKVSLTWRGSVAYHRYREHIVIAQDATAAYNKVHREMDDSDKRAAFISLVEMIAETT